MVEESRKIVLLVHGPESVDSGLASNVLEILTSMGKVEAKVGGATAVAAVIDSGLEDVIDISKRELPSVAIRSVDERTKVAVLVNYGKDDESSIAFGRSVNRKVGEKDITLIQVDREAIFLWRGDEDTITRAIMAGTGLALRDMRMDSEGTDHAGDRIISGVRIGENVWINGHVIGKATSRNVRIGLQADGGIRAEGIELKETGVRRLGDFDPMTAIIRSGRTRRTHSKPRALARKGGMTCLIDHCAEESPFKCRDAAYVVTVGDDTSKIASSILYRFGIPVIAITDGDEDGISEELLPFPGSHIFRLEPGNDDIVGSKVRELYFAEGHCLETSIDMEGMIERVRALCQGKLLWERDY